MHLRLDRYRDSDKFNYTAGLLYVKNRFSFYTIEPGKAERVPDGDYWLKLRYSPKFSDLPQYGHDLLWLTGMGQDKRYSLIHIGNFPKDTDACVLPAWGAQFSDTGEYRTINSTSAYHALYEDVSYYVKNVGPVPLTIRSV